MTELDAKGVIFLLGTLWDNYRVPTTEDDLTAKISAWCGLFGKVDREEVEETIYSIAAEGAEFAPQIGQVYARLRERRQGRRVLQRPSCDPDHFQNCLGYAIITGQPPPPEGATNEDLSRWFQDTKERVRRTRIQEGRCEDHT